MYEIILAFITSFCLTYVAIPSIIHIARKKNLVDEICWLLNSLGIKYTLTHKTKTGYIKKDGTEADTWRIYFTSSKKMPCFRLKRKYNRLSDLPLRGSDRKAIVDIPVNFA